MTPHSSLGRGRGDTLSSKEALVTSGDWAIAFLLLLFETVDETIKVFFVPGSLTMKDNNRFAQLSPVVESVGVLLTLSTLNLPDFGQFRWAPTPATQSTKSVREIMGMRDKLLIEVEMFNREAQDGVRALVFLANECQSQQQFISRIRNNGTKEETMNTNCGGASLRTPYPVGKS